MDERDALEMLVGEWDVLASSGGQPVQRSRMTAAWSEDRQFMGLRQVERPADFEQPREWVEGSPLPTAMIIGADDFSGEYGVLYADARGVSRVWRMTLDGAQWRIWGRPGAEFHQRFVGTIAADGNSIDGRWEASADGERWRTDFDVTYRRTR